MKNKEQIYDEQVSPLMSQIIEICMRNKIAMLTSFSIPIEDDPTLACTTALLADDYEPPEAMVHAVKILVNQPPPPLMLSAEEADGTKTMTSIIG